MQFENSEEKSDHFNEGRLWNKGTHSLVLFLLQVILSKMNSFRTHKKQCIVHSNENRADYYEFFSLSLHSIDFGNFVFQISKQLRKSRKK